MLVDYFPFEEIISANRPVGLDIETSVRFNPKHADPFRDDILAIQISDGENCWIVTNPDGMKSVNPVLSAGLIKIIHNANFDLQFLIHKLGADPNKQSLWDSLLMERLLHAGEFGIWHGLDDVMARRYGILMDKDIRESFKHHEGEFTEKQLNYMQEDVVHMPRLFRNQFEDISRMQLGRVAGLENRILAAVARMTLTGVRFDEQLWKEYVPQIREAMDKTEGGVADKLDDSRQLTLFGGSKTVFNMGSTPQLMELFKSLKIPLKTTNKDEINAYLQDHPNYEHADVLRGITNWRKWRHMLSAPYTEHVNPVSGRIHPGWNQVGADTGRFSCSEPNLQNVSRPEDGVPNFRHLFIPAADMVFIIADYSQQEPRIYAELSGDEAMRKACSTTDVYSSMGTEIFGREVTKGNPLRQTTKTGVLAYLYGAQADTLAEHLEVSIQEAQSFMNSTARAFPQAKRYAERARNSALSNAMTRTLLGRIRHYPQLKEKHFSARILNEAVNMPIQGSGADMLKMAIDRWDDLQTERNHTEQLCLTIHDELVVQSKPDAADEMYYQLLGCMEAAGAELCPNVTTAAEGKISPLWEK
jgi:DNA polymerase I-like protein with 3'-5' exonuclease and polymerase domains